MADYLGLRTDRYLRCGAECSYLTAASMMEPSPSLLCIRVYACSSKHAAGQRCGGLCECC